MSPNESMSMRKQFRSGCPIASSLDIIGDKWSMLIVRDMLLQGKKTFKEFSASPEQIAPGILSARLKWLVGNGLMTKRKLPGNKKENVYLLEEKGIALAPVLLELILWGDANVKSQNPEMYPLDEWGFDRDKASVLEAVLTQYRQMMASLTD